MSTRHPATLPCHDVLCRLARNDPQSFETLRLELIADTINDAPMRTQLRLRQLQFRIDGIRQLAHSPLGATIKLQAMMWESFLGMNEQLQDFSSQPPRPSLAKPVNAVQSASQHYAQVIEIEARRRRTPHADHR